MEVQIIGLTTTTKEEVMDFFQGLADRGYDYHATCSERGALYDISFDMNDLVISKVLDGVDFTRQTSHNDSFYIDSEDFVEIKLG